MQTSPHVAICIYSHLLSQEDGDTTGTSCADVDSVWISNVMQRDANTSSDNLTRLMFSWNPDPEIAAQNRSEYNYTLVVGKKDAGIFEDVHRVQTVSEWI